MLRRKRPRNPRAKQTKFKGSGAANAPPLFASISGEDILYRQLENICDFECERQ
jgi:hypothetical protein